MAGRLDPGVAELLFELLPLVGAVVTVVAAGAVDAVDAVGGLIRSNV